MAHFAKIEDGIVTDVHVVNNAVITDENGDEQESLGVAFLEGLHGDDINWVQTSYNGSFRKQYAQVGFSYDSSADEFVSPAPYASWTLDGSNDWQPPIAKPTDDAGEDKIWEWDEEVYQNDTNDPKTEGWVKFP
jgi:hypothetical protein